MAYGKNLYKVEFQDPLHTSTYIVRAYSTKQGFDILKRNGVEITYPLRVECLNGGLKLPEGVSYLENVDLYHRRVTTPNKVLNLYFPFEESEIVEFDNTCCDIIECVAKNVTIITEER